MATTGKILFQGLLSASDAILYSPDGVDAYVDQVLVKNVDSSARDLTLAVVKGGAVISTASEMYDAETIAVSTKPQSLSLLINARLEPSDALRGFSSAVNTLQLTVFGREIS